MAGRTASSAENKGDMYDFYTTANSPVYQASFQGKGFPGSRSSRNIQHACLVAGMMILKTKCLQGVQLENLIDACFNPILPGGGVGLISNCYNFNNLQAIAVKLCEFS